MYLLVNSLKPSEVQRGGGTGRLQTLEKPVDHVCNIGWQSWFIAADVPRAVATVHVIPSIPAQLCLCTMSKLLRYYFETPI